LTTDAVLRRSWHDDGVLLLRGALSEAEVATLRQNLRPLLAVVSQGEVHTTRIDNALERTAALDGLLDHPSVLPWLVDLLGSRFALLGSEIYARRASESQIHELHMDGGPSLWNIVLEPSSLCLTLKVQFFLTDLETRDNGNFLYVPGSHRRRPQAVTDDEVIFPASARTESVQLLARAGDAVIFPWSLWHGVAPNKHGRTRESVILRFGQLWCRPNDHWALDTKTCERLSPRQRRIAGALPADAPPLAWYFPPNQRDIILDELP
jgi:ectoine hydroxylase-related dioxygenase (phytanoyl-CoA dioxygenase family)